jgi:hypothetical protein
MSATKRDSVDGCGTPEDEFWRGYEESFSAEPPADTDLEAMAARDAEYRRIKNAETETGPCGQREGW